MIRRPPRSTLFPTRRSSDLYHGCYLKREGRSHSLWCNPKTGHVEAVPRHTEVGIEIGRAQRLNSSHGYISYAVFCLKKKKEKQHIPYRRHHSSEHTRRCGHG